MLKPEIIFFNPIYFINLYEQKLEQKFEQLLKMNSRNPGPEF